MSPSQTYSKTFGPRRSGKLDRGGVLLHAFLLFPAFPFSNGALAQDKFAIVPEKLLPFVTNGEIAGAVALVATKDRVLHISAVGQSNLASGGKMKTTDLFWIASMSKPITAVAVALQPNPDNSAMRRAYQDAVAVALNRK